MGTSTYVKTNDQVKRSRGKSGAKRGTRLDIDVLMVLFVVTLVIFGLLMVYSASSDFSFRQNGDATYIFRRQILWVLLGSASAFILYRLNYHRWRSVALYAMIGTIILLCAVLVIQEERLGAFRSLIKGSIQPSELAKLMLVVYLSVWFYNRRDQLHDVSFALLPLSVILGVLGFLIFRQPDLSAVITIGLLGGLMFFLAGGELRQIFIFLVMGVVVGLLLMMISTTGRTRITDFIAGLQDLMKSSDHVKTSIEAFVKGGWFGTGIGKSQTKLTVLPFPHTDSIFAVVGEETGVLGAVFLVCLYIGLIWRGWTISQRTTDPFGRLLAGGLISWIAIEATINMAVMVGLMPFAGNALPFISAGGSSMVMMLSAVGIIMSVHRLSEENRQEEENVFSAVVDLRRRDRRRRVSRDVRSTSSTRQ
jgi:cell division protein FtsW